MVLLPQPLGPSIDTNSPRCAVNDTLSQRSNQTLPLRIARARHQYANTPNPLRLLRPCRDRPRRRRAAEQRDELAPLIIRSPRRRLLAESGAL